MLISKILCNFAAQNQKDGDATPEFIHNNTKDMSDEEFEEKLKEGLIKTAKMVVEQHRRDNQPLIFCENGEVKYVDPFTVSI